MKCHSVTGFLSLSARNANFWSKVPPGKQALAFSDAAHGSWTRCESHFTRLLQVQAAEVR